MRDRTRSEILQLTESYLQLKSESLDSTRKQLNLISKVSKTYNVSTNELNDISKLLEFKMLIGFISLDLTTASRTYLKAEFQYEGIFSLRSFIVVINEGYKKIYNFKKTNKHGDEILTERNKSYWIKHIGNIVESRENLKIKKKYVHLTNELERYYSDNFNGIKEQRDLSIHYDIDIVKVYDILSELNSEVVFKKFIPFYDLLEQIFRFTHDLILSYQIKELNNS